MGMLETLQTNNNDVPIMFGSNITFQYHVLMMVPALSDSSLDHVTVRNKHKMDLLVPFSQKKITTDRLNTLIFSV